MAGNKNSGRRPKATALKVLTGNPGKRPLNDSEPKPPVGDVSRPEWLSVAAVGVWDRVAPVAIAMGTLTTADVSAFATFCELEATRRAISSHKDASPGDFSAREERETANALRPYYEKFGLEPSGRSRIKLPDAKPANPLDRFLKRA